MTNTRKELALISALLLITMSVLMAPPPPPAMPTEEKLKEASANALRAQATQPRTSRPSTPAAERAPIARPVTPAAHLSHHEKALADKIAARKIEASSGQASDHYENIKNLINQKKQAGETVKMPVKTKAALKNLLSQIGYDQTIKEEEFGLLLQLVSGYLSRLEGEEVEVVAFVPRTRPADSRPGTPSARPATPSQMPALTQEQLAAHITTMGERSASRGASRPGTPAAPALEPKPIDSRSTQAAKPPVAPRPKTPGDRPPVAPKPKTPVAAQSMRPIGSRPTTPAAPAQQPTNIVRPIPVRSENSIQKTLREKREARAAQAAKELKSL